MVFDSPSVALTAEGHLRSRCSIEALDASKFIAALYSNTALLVYCDSLRRAILLFETETRIIETVGLKKLSYPLPPIFAGDICVFR